jgi:hypothetical protein
MSWLAIAAAKASPVQAFKDWFFDEARKWPKLKRLIRKGVKPSEEQVTTSIPAFLELQRDQSGVRSISVNEGMLYDEAKKRGLTSAEASQVVPRNVQWLDTWLSIPTPHKPIFETDKERAARQRLRDKGKGQTVPSGVPRAPYLPVGEEVEVAPAPAAKPAAPPTRTREEKAGEQAVKPFEEQLKSLEEQYPFAPEGDPLAEEPTRGPGPRSRDPLDALSPEDKKSVKQILMEMLRTKQIEKKDLPSKKEEVASWFAPFAPGGDKPEDEPETGVDYELADEPAEGEPGAEDAPRSGLVQGAISQARVDQIIEEMNRGLSSMKTRR